MRETLWEEFAHSFETHAEHVALRMGHDYLTFAEIDNWSCQVARQLSDLGVNQGDRVALYFRNCFEFVVCDVAIARLGAVKVPMNYMLPRESIAYMLERSNARAVIYGADLVDDDFAGLATSIRVVSGVGVRPSGQGVHRLASRPTTRVTPFGEGAVNSGAPAAIYFTGGTTGRPKGVLHTQASTVALHYAQMLEAEITDSDRLLLMTPLAHAAGLFTQTALIRGATVVLTDGFDAPGMVELLRSQLISWTFLVPTMIYRLLDSMDASGETSTFLRTVVYGAAPISPERLRQALRMFGPVFVQLYGQTECPNWGTKLAKSDHDPERPGLLASCGRASIAADVQVVNEEGRLVVRGEIGEICLRSPYTLKEYLEDPENTDAKFLGSWIRTGDIGVMDEAGYLYLRDRKNDMIITGGMNVYCREVEDVLGQHPEVRFVAVIGIPHPDWGEAVHAVVVKGGGQLTDTELIAWSRSQLAAYAAPKSVEFVDSLPETAFGKIDKKALRAPYWHDQTRAIG